MKVEYGFIKLYRGIMENHLWDHKPFSYGQAWVHMLMIANHKEGTVWVNKSPIKVNRGEIGWSQDRLAKEFGWSRQQVRTFINHLKRDHMINHVNHGRISIISIINYDKYNGDNQEVNNPVTTSQPTHNQPVTTNKKLKKLKNEKNKEKGDFILLFPLDFQTNEDFRKAWADWEQHRKEIKKKLTPLSVTKIVNDLKSRPIEEVVRMIENAIAKGWQGIYEISGPVKEKSNYDPTGGWGS